VRSGLAVTLKLPADAKVVAVATVRVRTKHRHKLHEVKLSRTVTKKAKAGTVKLVLPPSSASRSVLTGRTTPLSVRLSLQITYADRTTRHVIRHVTLTPPKRPTSHHGRGAR